MATYYIPTDYTGGTILVNDGDVFIFEAGANSDVKFESASGTATNFDIEFNTSNSNGFDVVVEYDLSPTIVIADNVALDSVFIKTQHADEVDLTIGDNVTLEQYQGSDVGTDTVVIGENFTTTKDFKTGKGDDHITIGENATAPKFDTGEDTDTVVTRDPDVNISNAETIIEPDGVVDGTGGDDVIGAGYSDAQTDSVDGDDGDADTIIGYSGNDTIDGGAGDDVIYGDYEQGYVAPPDPAAGAEQLSFVIDNADLNNGQVKIEVDQFSADKNLANDLTITDTTTGALTQLEVSKFGGGDNAADVIRVDLTTFDDDFELIIKDEDTPDKIFLIGVEQSNDNGDGTFTYTYVGSDAQVHSVTVDPDNATIETYQAQLDTTASSDVIDGGDGNDTIYSGGGDDYVAGGDGDDVIVTETGSDTIAGGSGADWISAGDGMDYVDYSASDAGVSVDLPTASGSGGDAQGDTLYGVDGVIGSAFDDTIVGYDAEGTAGPNYFSNDFEGGDGDDLLDGRGGSDTLDGGAGNDTLLGGAGDDSLIGGEGDDSFSAGAGVDQVVGGDGSDTLVVTDGDDTIYFDGGSGTRDIDVIDLSGVSSGVSANHTNLNNGSEYVFFSNVEHLIGTNDDDVVTFASSGTSVTLEGGGGDDILMGGQSDDLIYGGEGADTLYGIGDGSGDLMDGGDGNDSFFAFDGFGSDTIIGGDGSDRVTLTSLNSAVTANFTAPYAGTISTGSDTITFSETEIYDFTAYDDTVYGGDTYLNLYAGDGDDLIVGSSVSDGLHLGAGNDIASGGLGNDYIRGVLGDDTISGDGGTDWLYGGDGDDSVSGGDGADLVSGDGGSDTLSGDAGDDTMIAGSGSDLIDGGSGTDTYDASSSGSLIDDSISVTVDQSGDGTVAKTNDSTTDTVTSVETYIADEVDGQTDSITLTGNIDRNEISGLSDDALGVFTPDNGGDPIAFGGANEPTINQLLSGNYDPGSGIIQPKGSYQITGGEEDGAQIGTTSFSNFERAAFSVVCYAPDSLIETPGGARRVDALAPGDLVETLDAGPRPVRWLRSSDQALESVADDNRPVLIRAGALGGGRPVQDLIVSPQHRILAGGQEQLDHVFREECFVPAKALTCLPGVRHMRGKRKITWVHFALDQHHVIHANGLLSESLFLGPMVVNGLAPDERVALQEIFGPVPQNGSAMNGPPARPFMTVGKAVRQLKQLGKPRPSWRKQRAPLDLVSAAYLHDRHRSANMGFFLR